MVMLFISLIVLVIFIGGVLLMFTDRISATLIRLTSNTRIMSWHKRLGVYSSALLVGLYMAISGILILILFAWLIQGLVEVFRPSNLPPWFKNLTVFAVFMGLFCGALLRRRKAIPRS